ncbi:MAG: hypothetical protein DWQ31_15245 [Planctomycetota bacterium]|nr:MAG: hypothetical protein DWQ31_15245 [Planctomycetota bacterium]
MRPPAPPRDAQRGPDRTAAASRVLRLVAAISFLGTAAAAVVTESRADDESPRPHIVIYLGDDHGQEFLGCYGNEAIRTPHLDALARDGIRLNRAFAVTSTCTPSRSVLYTGLYPAENGSLANHTSCRDDVRALPAYLRPLGYRVVLVGKTHVAPRRVFDFELLRAQLPPGPDGPPRFRSPGLDIGVVEQFLGEHRASSPNQPLCLILADDNPHVVWEKNKIYEPARLPLSPRMVDTPQTRAALANYYQDITTLDARIGRLRAALDRHGYAQNTLFLYTSDQGSEWPKSKWTVYDAGLRVPFLAVWPEKIPAGRTTNALVSFVDVLPTLVEAAGGDAAQIDATPGGTDPGDARDGDARDGDVADGDVVVGDRADPFAGRSFLAVLRGEQDTFREFVYGTHTGDGRMNLFPQRSVRGERYKYILNLRPDVKWKTHFTEVDGIPLSHRDVYATWLDRAKTDATAARLIDAIENHPAEEFYDLEADPDELDNLIERPEHAVRIAEYRARLAAWMKATGDEGLATEAREAERHRRERQRGR